MTSKGSRELQECKNELSKIIRELKDIEFHIRYDYTNVGNVQCADSIKSVIEEYESAWRTLNSIPPSTLDQLKEAAERVKAAAEKATAK